MKIGLILLVAVLLFAAGNATVRFIDAVNSGKEIWNVKCGEREEYAINVQIQGVWIKYTAMAWDQERIGQNCLASRLGF